MGKEKIIRLQVDVPESIRTRLKLEAVRTGQNMGEVAEEILDEGLRKREEQNK